MNLYKRLVYDIGITKPKYDKFSSQCSLKYFYTFCILFYSIIIFISSDVYYTITHIRQIKSIKLGYYYKTRHK